MASPFKPDKLYHFRYRPKLSEVLPFWDKQPLMFPLHITKDRTLGLNIHWIPFAFRKRFVEFLIKLSLKVRSPKRFAQLTYEIIKNDPSLKSALPGIRMYINNRASSIKEIDKDGAQDFFIPARMNRNLFRENRAKKVFFSHRIKR